MNYLTNNLDTLSINKFIILLYKLNSLYVYKNSIYHKTIPQLNQEQNLLIKSLKYYRFKLF